MAEIVLTVDDCEAARSILMRGVREAVGAHADAATPGVSLEGLRTPPLAAFDLILADLVAPDARGARQARASAAIFRPFLK